MTESASPWLVRVLLTGLVPPVLVVTPPGAAGPHFHDLRGSGSTLASQNRATLAELMHRLGHRSVVAAMRYHHPSADRDRMLADRLGESIRRARSESESDEAEVSSIAFGVASPYPMESSVHTPPAGADGDTGRTGSQRARLRCKSACTADKGEMTDCGGRCQYEP
jgi:hypothetical protein